MLSFRCMRVHRGRVGWREYGSSLDDGRKASFLTTSRKALEFYAWTLASGLNGGGRMELSLMVDQCLQ